MAVTQGAVPEAILVKDVLTTCQSINGRYIWLQGTSAAGARFACGPGAEVSATQQQLVGRIAELGWLLRRITELCTACCGVRSAVHEALAAAAQREVRSYYRLLAVLESQVVQQPAQPGGPARPTTPAGEAGPAAAPALSLPDGLPGFEAAAPGSSSSDLSLRRLEVWLAEPLSRLRVLAACLDAAQPQQGGQLLSCLHQQSKHGDALVRAVVAPLLHEACAPFFSQVARWVLDGALDSLAGTKFMVVRCTPPNDHPATLWRAGFALDPGVQPHFISAELAQQVLSAGKTIHFLRGACGDTAWASKLPPAAQAPDASSGVGKQLRWLESTVKDISTGVSLHLRDIVLKQHRLPAHLSALRRFLLLGQGDFVQSLLDLAAAELDKPAREVSPYTLQGHLDTALRGSSTAGEDPDLLSRVGVRLGRAMDGDRGWDVFALQYRVSEPALSVVLSPDAMAAYLRVSRLLWAIKRTEQVLAGAWEAINGAQHGLAAIREVARREGVEVEGVEQVPALLRLFHARRGEMAQFLTSLQSYLLFEVLEPAWGRLLSALPSTSSLDELISLHERALEEICHGMFLAQAPPAAPASGAPAASAQEVPAAVFSSVGADVQAALRAVLRAVLDVGGPVQRLAGLVEQAVAEQQLYLRRASESEEAGAWNEQVLNSPAVDAELLGELIGGMRRVHANFERTLRAFLALLPDAQADRLLLARGDLVAAGGSSLNK